MLALPRNDAHTCRRLEIETDAARLHADVQALNRAIAAGGGLGSAGVPPALTAVPGGDGKAEMANVRTCTRTTRLAALSLAAFA